MDLVQAAVEDAVVVKDETSSVQFIGFKLLLSRQRFVVCRNFLALSVREIVRYQGPQMLANIVQLVDAARLLCAASR